MISKFDEARRILDAMSLDLTLELEASMVDHPKVSTDPLRRVAVVVEEAGEAMQAVLDLTRFGPRTADVAVDELAARVYRELMQTATAAIRVCYEIERKRIQMEDR